jgi:hypothetical protein
MLCIMLDTDPLPSPAVCVGVVDWVTGVFTDGLTPPAPAVPLPVLISMMLIGAVVLVVLRVEVFCGIE